jgi:hypothetical protein
MNPMQLERAMSGTATITGSVSPSLSARTLMNDIIQVKEDIALLEMACPFRQFMIKEGRSPDDGWVMVVPAGRFQKDQIKNLPRYVQESALIDKMTFVNTNIANDIPVVRPAARFTYI